MRLLTVCVAVLVSVVPVRVDAWGGQKAEVTASELAAALNEARHVAVYGILFESGKATIRPESARVLASIGELLQSDTTLKLEIQGYTDNVGSAAVNLKVSRDRAQAVKTYLVENLGIAPARLTTSGFGVAKPVGDNKTEPGRALNRRIELVRK